MNKQQIVIRIPSGDDKDGSKALKTASTMKGVVSVEIVRERNHLVVKGVGVDSVELTRSLRRKFGSAEIVSVTNTREEAFFRQYDDDFRHQDQVFQNYIPTHSYHQPPYNYYMPVPVLHSDPSPTCSIL